MDFKLIGQFATTGNIVASDPCYELNEDNKHLVVKPGTYDVYIVSGQLNDPLFAIDEQEDFSRVAELVIINTEYSADLNFNKIKAYIGIDSGQCGFFNKEFYGKDHTADYCQVGRTLSFMRNQVWSKRIDIENTEKILTETDNNEHYRHMKKECFNNSDEQAKKFYEAELIVNQGSLKRFQQHLAEQTCPDYLKPEVTREFYEIMCDLTNLPAGAGVLEPYGAVSSSGLGDGSAQLSVAKDATGDIVAACLSYLELEDLI